MRINQLVNVVLVTVVFSAFVVFLVGCSSGEEILSESVPQGPSPDAAYFNPKPDAAPDQATEAAVGSDAAAAYSAECQQYGTDQKITVFMRAPSGPDKLKVMGGWLNFPDYDADDTKWSTWCWADAGANELACIPPDAKGQGAANYPGTYVEFAPAAASSKGEDPATWGYYCGLKGCIEGTFVVCSGKLEVCRVTQGALKGTAELKDWNNDGYPNIRCQI